tara:strand:+ start:1123 stop:1644 length:522 start_codon:yes stop_codon:yes gene_type:complete
MSLPTTTSYVARADADTYFATSFNNASWGALSDSQKDLALQVATRNLETLQWYGKKCVTDQSLQWPREIAAEGSTDATVCTTLPNQIVEATCELALKLHNNQSIFISNPESGTTGTFVSKERIGELEVEYEEYDGVKSISSGPKIIVLFPWLKELLRSYAKVGSKSVMTAVRS